MDDGGGGQKRGGVEDDIAEGRRYIRATLRSTAAVTGFVVFMLAAYRQAWAIIPLLVGVALGAGLLVGWDVAVRRLFSPDAVRKSGRNRTWALLAFALVKYPLVGLLLWAIARFWSLKQVMVFVGGFLLLHAVIGLRALGRALTENNSKHSSY